jgi:hypothetical protein
MALPSEAMLVLNRGLNRELNRESVRILCSQKPRKYLKSQGRSGACTETSGQKPSKYVRAQVPLQYLTRPNPLKQGLRMN